jgi:hypothetical protein
MSILVVMTQIQHQHNPQLIKNTKLHHHETNRHGRDYHDADDYADEHGMLLHVAYQGHPPPWIIQTLCAVQPQWFSCRKNAFLYTPLHVAAAWGAHPEVVQYLTQLQPDTAQWQDSCGYTPLHLHTRDGRREQKASSFGLARTEIWWGGSSSATAPGGGSRE